MWIMAVNTEQVLFVSVPVSGPLAMYTYFPVTEFVTMALAAQPVRLGKVNQLTGNQPQLVTVNQVMAVSTPTLAFGMVQHNLGMIFGKCSPLRIWLHVGMALRTGEDSFGERRSRDGKRFFGHIVFDVVCRLLFGRCLVRDNQLPGSVEFLYSGGITRYARQ
jgi:hypothetical protein